MVGCFCQQRLRQKIKNCSNGGNNNTRNIHKSPLSIYEFVCVSSVSPDAGFQSHQSCLEWLIRCDKACGRISLRLEKTGGLWEILRGVGSILGALSGVTLQKGTTSGPDHSPGWSRRKPPGRQQVRSDPSSTCR